MSHMRTIDTLLAMKNASVGSTHVERIALLLLAETGEPLSMSDIAGRVGLSRAALTTLVDRLVRSGLVRRDYEHGGDRRRVAIIVTPKGLKAIERAEAKVPA